MPGALRELPSKLSPDRQRLLQAFMAVRRETERRAAPLSAEDQVIQSMADASPTKCHRAHTTRFFETFLVQPNVPGYKVFDPRFAFLFNSYYVAAVIEFGQNGFVAATTDAIAKRVGVSQRRNRSGRTR